MDYEVFLLSRVKEEYDRTAVILDATLNVEGGDHAEDDARTDADEQPAIA